MVVVVLIMWAVTLWDLRTWTTGNKAPTIPSSTFVGTVLAILGLVPFVATAVTGEIEPLFITNGAAVFGAGVWMIAARSDAYRPEPESDSIRHRENAITTAALTVILTAIFVVGLR